MQVFYSICGRVKVLHSKHTSYQCEWGNNVDEKHYWVKFIYSEKAAKFCKIFTLLLSYVVPVKSKVKISLNFLAFSEYMSFKRKFREKNRRFRNRENMRWAWPFVVTSKSNKASTWFWSVGRVLMSFSADICRKVPCSFLKLNKRKYNDQN